MQSAECTMQNAQCTMQNAKCKIKPSPAEKVAAEQTDEESIVCAFLISSSTAS